MCAAGFGVSFTYRQDSAGPTRHSLTCLSFSSASLVLNFFCTSFIRRNAVVRLRAGGCNDPADLEFELRYVL